MENFRLLHETLSQSVCLLNLLPLENIKNKSIEEFLGEQQELIYKIAFFTTSIANSQLEDLTYKSYQDLYLDLQKDGYLKTKEDILLTGAYEKFNNMLDVTSVVENNVKTLQNVLQKLPLNRLKEEMEKSLKNKTYRKKFKITDLT